MFFSLKNKILENYNPHRKREAISSSVVRIGDVALCAAGFELDVTCSYIHHDYCPSTQAPRDSTPHMESTQSTLCSSKQALASVYAEARVIGQSLVARSKTSEDEPVLHAGNYSNLPAI